MKNIRQAVIAAGGKGERLRPLTNNLPKPMVHVNNRPFLEYVIEMLRSNSISEIVLLLGYKAEIITNHFGDGSKFGVKIKYSITPIEDNNGTRLRKAIDLVDENFFFIFGDTYLPISFDETISNFNKMNVLSQMTIYNNKDGDGEFGDNNNIKLVDGYVKNYDDFQKSPLRQGIDVGYYILNKKAFGLMPKNDFLFQTDFLADILIPKGETSGFGTDEKYCTINNIELLKKAEEYFIKNSPFHYRQKVI